MTPSYDSAIVLLNSCGAGTIAHTGRSLLKHLEGTYAFLKFWKAETDVCIAGLLHSVYGTAAGKILLNEPPDRSDIVALFGTRVDHLIYSYSRINTDSTNFHLSSSNDHVKAVRLIMLANIVEQTLYLPNYFVPRLEREMSENRSCFPAEVCQWVDDFSASALDAIGRKK
jgi:(p)ppGpp synthase/HD superfamily hydrolase